MILESMLEDTAGLNEDLIFDEQESIDLACGIEAAYGEMMLECAKKEFSQYVNEGTIALNEADIIESIKNFFQKIWNFIKKWFNKFVQYFEKKFAGAFKFYQINEKKIISGCAKVKDFKGYEGLITLNKLTKECENILKEIPQKGSNASYDGDSARAVLNSALGLKNGEQTLASQVVEKIRGKFNSDIRYTADQVKDMIGSRTATQTLKNNIALAKAGLDDFETAMVKTDPASQDKKFNAMKSVVNDYSRICTELTKLVDNAISQAFGFAKAAVKATGKKGDATSDDNLSDKAIKGGLKEESMAEVNEFINSLGIE